MGKEDTVFELPPSERDDYYSDDSLYNINSWGADLSFRELITQYDEGDLLKPELQRNYVWDKSEASRFIDSILLGLPVPSIFLAKTPDQKMLIIDGYQRIMTVHDYVKGIFSKDGKVFKLTNSEKINERWRGKAFSELTHAEQRKIRTTTIHCIIFVQVHPKDNDTSMYQIFERINTSGRTLLPQEIRNCVYQGPFNTLLIELNTEANWRRLYGLERPDPRMRDMEFILRYLALDSEEFRQVDAKQISLKKFLNEFMGAKRSNAPDVLKRREEKFLLTIRFIAEHIGAQAFHNISPKDPYKLVKKFNPTIFDSIMLATSSVLRRGIDIASLGNLEERRLALLRNDEYQDLIRVRTTNVLRIWRRISLATQHLYGMEYE